jgi:Na+-driven multidrug efflux pump
MSQRLYKDQDMGSAFSILFQMGNAMLVGTNNSRYMKYGFFIEAVLNIFLDYSLIYGILVYPVRF